MFNPTPQFKVPPSVPAQTQTQTTPAPPAPDPSVERQDGSRAIEVTAMFGDTVLDVRHLDSTTPSGKISALTWALAGAGWATFLAGAVLAVVGHYGLGSLLLLGGLGLGLSGNMRRRAEQGSPDYALGEASESNLHLRHEAIPTSCFPLVESTTSGHVLNYTPRMGGDMTLGQSRVGLADLVSTGQVQASTDYPGTYRLPIPRDARIKVDIGENTFLVNSVAPARQVTSPLIAQIDWNKQTFTGLSVGAHALALMLVFLVPSSPKMVGTDVFDRGMKMVDVLITPLKEEVPQWLRKNKVQDNEPGQLGKAHKGEAGKMGDKKSKAKNKQFGIKGPRDNAKPVMAKRLAEQTARKYGVLGILGAKTGGHLASIFGADEALGNDVVDALGNLQGNSVGSAYGIGGLGIAGTGRYGGGLGEGTIGHGPLGTIGKCRGRNCRPGDVGYGSGVGTLRKRKVGRTPPPRGRVIVKGSLDKSIIRRVIRRHINEVKYCYQNELQSSPDLYGRVVINFSIMGNGQVAASKVERSTMKNRRVESCVTRAVRRWLFPKPMNGGVVVVSYPFVFHSAGTGA